MTSMTDRILSLDVFRGITIALMILVNSQLSNSGYALLLHAEWNGCTLADLVFPSFLFIVGLTAVVSLHRQIEIQKKTTLYGELFKRSIILFLLGLFLNIFPFYIHYSTLRVYGILQRIALCYLIGSFIYLNTSIRTQWILFFGILLGYWFIMTQVPVPGWGTNQLTPNGSWVAYWDQLLFSPAHLYNKTYDPEGFLSTFPSIATTLLGVITGQLLIDKKKSKQKKFYFMIVGGLIALGLGWVWDASFPINKNLWTSSFVLWSGGIALMVFSYCFLLIDVLGYQKWSWPFKVFGMNALFAFIFHVLLLKMQILYTIKLENGTVVSLKTWISNALFAHYSIPHAALLYSILFLLFNFLVVLFLYRRKLFIRV